MLQVVTAPPARGQQRGGGRGERRRGGRERGQGDRRGRWVGRVSGSRHLAGPARVHRDVAQALLATQPRQCLGQGLQARRVIGTDRAARRVSDAERCRPELPDQQLDPDGPIACIDHDPVGAPAICRLDRGPARQLEVAAAWARAHELVPRGGIGAQRRSTPRAIGGHGRQYGGGATREQRGRHRAAPPGGMATVAHDNKPMAKNAGGGDSGVVSRSSPPTTGPTSHPPLVGLPSRPRTGQKIAAGGAQRICRPPDAMLHRRPREFG